jgi:N-methylhydantoinase A/oxoprolinase/acetone carboxylase beta subunit/N-methylhydantoinase B/oxoprolinase/acetone carboxylase alpha subunit
MNPTRANSQPQTRNSKLGHRYRIAADTGGTFTDFVYFDELSNRLHVAKVLSTPDDPSEAVAAGIVDLLDQGVEAEQVVFLSHGTTVGTNALLEGKGARTGLLVTEGFRGIYEVQEQMRGYGSAVFDFYNRKSPLLAAPRDTLEVLERISASGEVVCRLEQAEARQLARQARALGVDSVAICLLFSFLNPEHERLLRRALAKEAPDLPVSLSCDVLPQIREYYRLSTTVVNAYLRPVLERYLSRLERRLRELEVRTPQRYVMQSNGGVTTLPRAAARAVTTLLSGPAGGVIACQAIGRAAGRLNLITFDMGGTSCDVALVREGRPSVTTLTKVAGHDLAVPMLDIHTVSAGGGTIARVERLGHTSQLKVGPESAGARPGPVCYGQGGRQPTVTDANTVLGYLSPETRLGGRLSLDREAARAAIRGRVALPLNFEVEAAAEGVLKVVDVQMEEAIKAVSTRRGFDLRQFTLVAFGGAGPLHAARVARDLGVAEVLVPPYPGVTSALGLLMADVRHDYVRSRLDPLPTLDPSVANDMFATLEAEAIAELRAEGFGSDQISLLREVDLRYAGQGYEVTVAAPGGAWGAAELARLRASFDQEHERQFGHSAPDSVVELTSYRVAAVGLVPPLEPPLSPRPSWPIERARLPERTIYLGEAGGEVSCAVYDRARLGPGHRFAGPAIVEQLDATTLILPGQEVTVDDYGNLLLAVHGERHSAQGPPDLSGRSTDPITLEIIGATLDGVVQEMQNALFRTGYSTVIRESQDASCALLDRWGRLVAQHVVLPLHMGAFPACLASLLQAYPPETLREGDAFMVNHPYEGGVPHAPDMAIITPIFFEHELIGFSASMAHKSDIGGPVPGSCSAEARETFNEGLHLPPVRYYTAAVQNADLDRIIAANSRTPDVVLGDIHGQVGACRLGERRLQETIRKLGAPTVLGAFDRLCARAEGRVRAAISGWSDDEAEAERWIDDDGVDLGKPVRIHVSVRKRRDRIRFDFSQSNDQTRGPANVRPPLVRAACAFCLVTLIDPRLSINDGLLRVIELETRPGSVMDPRFPAPVNTYNPTMHALADAVFEALSALVPERKMADGCGARSIFVGGQQADAQRDYLLYELFGGGSGGRLGMDGVSGTTVNHSNGKIAPIEIIESEYPIRLSRFELIPDSGGAGQFRGGLGFAREYELLAEQARVSIRSTKHVIPPSGMDGGGAGRGGRCLAYVGTPDEWELPTRYGDLAISRGTRVRVETPGGGGFGDPFRRDPSRVLEDVLDGYVSREAAAERYGVVLRPTGTDGSGLEIDEAATAVLRAKSPLPPGEG